VLDRLDLELAPGSRTALLGPSGAGKTTLLRVLAGLQAPAAGRVAIGGRDVTGLPPRRRGVAMVFQEPRLLPHLSVRENVALGLRAEGVGRAARRARAGELLGLVGLADAADRPPRGLSGGEEQRVALARALAVRPDVLLLDEPLAAADAPLRAGLRRLVLELHAERPVTMLMVTHDRAEAAELGQTVAVLIGGRIAQHDTPRGVFERPVDEEVARFTGAVNLIRGEVRGGRMPLADAWVPVEGPDGAAVLALRPERLRVGPDGSLRALVREAAYTGGGVRLALDAGGVTLEALVPVDGAPSAGAVVGVEVPAAAVWRLPSAAPRPAPESVPAR
jgi:ABC-type Fe3+/spermidine/putrescine transport system ATPase subunit